ncbi:hypothetical protein B0H14DRAFT_2537600 [Mycena olivaceomarginata]|nr:hypothetical protein B0H14DRAFT_2537600 [Mycena olivaceomarginata]
MAENYRRRGLGGKLPYPVSLSCDPLFTSNTPPMCEQLEEIRESALVTRTLKCSLEQQITATRMQLLRLEPEEMYAVHHIERCKFLLAPIRRIPNEILSTIFVCYAEITHAPCIDVQRGVWILGHIFRHWRAVVLSTPAVWSSSRYFSMWEDARNPSAQAEEYLCCSGNLPSPLSFVTLQTMSRLSISKIHYRTPKMLQKMYSTPS